MDIVGVEDVQILDPDLLQLPCVSPSPLKASSHIADELFSHWLSLPETATLVLPSLLSFFFEYKHLRICVQHNCFMCVMFLQVKCLIDEAKSATPTNLSKSYSGGNALPSVFLSNGTPPLSPRSSPGSPRFSRQRASPPSLRSPLRSLKEPKHELIPQVCLHWILLLVTFECIALLLSDRGFGLVYMFT